MGAHGVWAASVSTMHVATSIAQLRRRAINLSLLIFQLKTFLLALDSLLLEQRHCSPLQHLSYVITLLAQPKGMR
jgi:hypothetical protein